MTWSILVCAKFSGPEWEKMVCSAIRIYTTFSARDFSVTSESWQGDSVAVNHQTPLLLWLYNFWINRQKLMKFVHVDSTFGYAATRSRAIKFHIKPLRWPTATGLKSTQTLVEVANYSLNQPMIWKSLEKSWFQSVRLSLWHMQLAAPCAALLYQCVDPVTWRHTCTHITR